MIPVEALPSRVRFERPRALLFDLDDTLLDEGTLTRTAYDALWSLAEAGLPLYAVTGRPAGWGEVIARQWPVRAVISENGAVRSERRGRVVESVVSGGRQAARARSMQREALVASMRAAIPALVLADDNGARLTDTTFDIGEHHVAAPEDVVAARALAASAGARTTVSSVHLHVSFEGDDKASGALAALAEREGLDPTAARSEVVYVGDSGNDASCFACFFASVGVANVRKSLRGFTVPPRFSTASPMGAGFAELAAVLEKMLLAR
jgi:HAD superfamily hydrolase (TIGR01484 family)